MRIRSQLLLLVLSLLLPALLASGVGVAYVYREGRQEQDRNLQEAASTLAQLVESELRIREATLQALAYSEALREGNLPRFYNHAKRLVSSPDSTVIVFDESGRQLLNTRRPLDANLPVKRVSNLQDMMRADGADRPLVSDLFFAPIAQQHEFAIQVPVNREATPPLYLVMGVNALQMQRLLEAQDYPKSWLTNVLDSQGVIIARSWNPAEYIGTKLHEQARTGLASAHQGVFDSVSMDGVPIKAYFHRVGKTDWRVVISIPHDELQQLPVRAATFLGSIFLALLGLAVMAAHWFARRAYQAVERLGETAEQLGTGGQVVYEMQHIHELDAVGRRITDASKQIAQSKEELEQRVAEAVAKTEQAQQALQRSQKLEALGRLTGGIAHEFNNLLQTLMTALQVAKLTSTQERVQALLDTCKKAVNRASTLTSQLSVFGRIQEARLTTIDLNEQIRGFQKLIEGILPSNIKLDLRIEQSVWPVTVDAVQLELALLNIAINARDAMPNGGTLSLSTRNEPLDQALDNLQPGEYVRICITDTGAGMAQDVLAKALDPFFTTKAIGKGTGLGLPQAYGFARQAEGTLLIDSALGQGTQVEILLPRSHEPVALTNTLPDEVSHPNAASGMVLFVEDDPLVREAVVPALGQAGFSVKVATNAEEALKVLESEGRVDALFSDIMMPGRLNGIELARTVQDRYPDIKVILATGYTDQHVKQEGVTLIGKPYDTDEVVRLLQNAIEGESGQTS